VVDMQTGHLTRWKPDSPAAAWYLFFFCTKIWLKEPNFRAKECSVPPYRRRNYLPGQRPRNSCNVTRVMRSFIKPGVSPAERQSRLRQHGTPCILVSKNSQHEFFETRPGFFRLAGGDIPRQMQDRLIHGSSGRCAVFAHVGLCVVQTPTA